MKVDEIIFIINLLERLRNHFKLSKSEIDEYANLNTRQYARMIEGKTSFDMKSLRDICKKIYNLSIKELLNLDGTLPSKEDLPQEIQTLTFNRNNVRSQEQIGLTSYLIIIINSYFKVDEVINNKTIRNHLPSDLAKKSIELGKTKINSLVENINTDSSSNRKIYKLKSEIPSVIIENAKKEVDKEWFEDFQKKIALEGVNQKEE